MVLDVADAESRFDEIYDRYSGLILAYAARRTSNAHDAADVLAETYMVAWLMARHPMSPHLSSPTGGGTI